MEQNYKAFVCTLYDFMSKLNSYHPSEKIENVLKMFNQLDMSKVIMRTHYLLENNKEFITNKDPQLFDKKFCILPGIDLSQFWFQLTKPQRKKGWTYINMLVLLSDLLVNAYGCTNSTPVPTSNYNQENTEQTVSTESCSGEDDGNCSAEKINITQLSTDTTQVSSAESSEVASSENFTLDNFNPYIGVGQNLQGGVYSVDDLFAGQKFEPAEFSGFDMESIAGMLGLDKHINFKEMGEKFKNMTKEEIDMATSSMKSLLGDKIDANTSQMLENIFTNISEELKSSDVNAGDPFKNMISIAKKVSNKIDVNNMNDADMRNIMRSAQNLAQQTRTSQGKPMFDPNQAQLFESVLSNSSNEEQQMQDCMKLLGSMSANSNPHMQTLLQAQLRAAQASSHSQSQSHSQGQNSKKTNKKN